MFKCLCPPHHWFVPSGKDGIALAKCMNCPLRQYQPIGVSKELLQQANKLNEKFHHPLIVISGKAMSNLKNYRKSPPGSTIHIESEAD